ncbi:MAG: HlyD family type I secretion periplasmic adaptor subunit [Pseudomonadota bacterium]
MTVTNISHDLLRTRIVLPALTVGTICVGMAAAGAWAAWANVVESSVATGQIVPSGRVKVVQSVDGGIVASLAVSEGDRVKEGAVLAVIDTAQADAILGESEAARTQLAINAHWLAALLRGEEPDFENPEWPARLVTRARQEYETISSAQRAAISVLEDARATKFLELQETEGRLDFAKRTVTLASERLTMIKGLAETGAASKDSLLSARSGSVEAEAELRALQLALPRLKASISEVETRKLESQASFRATLSTRLTETESKLDQLLEAQAGERNRVDRAVLRAPSAGVVKTVHPASAGEVVQPAQPVVEILPLEEDLLIRARVDPKDIAFIAPGLTATIRLTAYDYAAFGALKGEVTRIGVDSIQDEQGVSYFPVDVSVGGNELPDGRTLPILPGMVAEVHIVTGEKSVLEYLAKPIHRTVRTAFRER